MQGTIKKLGVSGFKSIRELKDFELRPLNIFIGVNGAGKSNLVQLFRMLMAMAGGYADKFVRENGGADNFLHNGPKWTRSIDISLELAPHGSGLVRSGAYTFTLTPTVDGTFIIDEEGENARDAIADWMAYHFHDTGASAPMRRWAIVQDCGKLHGDGGNIAPFLLALKQGADTAGRYREIVPAIRAVMPFFDDFDFAVTAFHRRRHCGGQARGRAIGFLPAATGRLRRMAGGVFLRGRTLEPQRHPGREQP